MSQVIHSVDLCGLSYAAQTEIMVSGSLPGALTIAADMQPGWLTRKSPDTLQLQGQDSTS